MSTRNPDPREIRPAEDVLVELESRQLERLEQMLPSRAKAMLAACAGIPTETLSTIVFENELEFFKEAMDLLTVISRRQGVTGPQLQQIERFLKATGKGIRQG